jgi:hypothetical protein
VDGRQCAAWPWIRMMANKSGKINILVPKIHLAHRCHFAEGATRGATCGGQIGPHQKNPPPSPRCCGARSTPTATRYRRASARCRPSWTASSRRRCGSRCRRGRCMRRRAWAADVAGERNNAIAISWPMPGSTRTSPIARAKAASPGRAPPIAKSGRRGSRPTSCSEGIGSR